MHRNVLEHLNAEKDTYYDAYAIKYIELISDIDFRQPIELPPLTLEQVTSMNSLLNQVFYFYGGYTQLSMNAKDEVGEAIIVKQLVAKIKDLQDEVVAKDSEV